MATVASPLLTRTEAAQYLRVSTDHVDRERIAGRLAFIQLKPNAKVFFRQSDLDAYLARAVHPARPPHTDRATFRKVRAK